MKAPITSLKRALGARASSPRTALVTSSRFSMIIVGVFPSGRFSRGAVPRGPHAFPCSRLLHQGHHARAAHEAPSGKRLVTLAAILQVRAALTDPLPLRDATGVDGRKQFPRPLVVMLQAQSLAGL